MGRSLVTLNVADFSSTPGGRYRAEGEFSGEEYREDHVEKFLTANPDADIAIDLDAPEGFQTSFLEEVFGGLVRTYGSAALERVTPIAPANPWRAEKALAYMKRALANR